MDGFKSGISHEKLDDLFGGSPILSETSRWVNTTLEEINIRHFVSHVCYCLFLILLLICLFSYFFYMSNAMNLLCIVKQLGGHKDPHEPTPQWRKCRVSH